MLNLQRFDLWAWANYTDTQKVAMLLWPTPRKLDRQHSKALVLLTFPTCAKLICSIQSHAHPARTPVPPSPSFPATTSPSPPLDDAHCQVCQSPFDEHKVLLCDIFKAGNVGIWTIWTVSSHPSSPFQLTPYVPLDTLYPRRKHDTLASLPLLLTPTPIKHRVAQRGKIFSKKNKNN